MNELNGLDLASISQPEHVFKKESGLLGLKRVATLGAGVMFGEKGIDEGVRRNATIIAKENCFFAIMTATDYRNILKEINIAKIENRKAFFADRVFPNVLPAQLMAPISYDFFKQKTKLSSGSQIYKQDEKPDYVYVVKKGKILLYREEPVHKLRMKHSMFVGETKGKVFKLGIIESGGIFGEYCLTHKTKRRFMSAKAITDVTLLKVTVACFIGHLFNFPDIGKFVLDNLKSKMHRRIDLLHNQFTNEKKYVSYKNSVNLGLYNILSKKKESDDGVSLENGGDEEFSEKVILGSEDDKNGTPRSFTMYLGKQYLARQKKLRIKNLPSITLPLKKRAYKTFLASKEDRIDKTILWGEEIINKGIQSLERDLRDNTVFKKYCQSSNRYQSEDCSILKKSVALPKTNRRDIVREISDNKRCKEGFYSILKGYKSETSTTQEKVKKKVLRRRIKHVQREKMIEQGYVTQGCINELRAFQMQNPNDDFIKVEQHGRRKMFIWEDTG